MTQPAKTLIAFATAWGTKFGGINSFNADLLDAVAAAFFSHLRTICVVLHATPDDIQAAQRNQITLVGLGLADKKELSSELEPLVWAKLQVALGAWNTADTVWLGHDRITGSIAITASQQRGGNAALIHHMSYERYEAFAESSAAAHSKEAEQKALFAQATHVMAVGPLLKDALVDMLGREDVPCLIPGLAEIEQRSTPKKFKVFLSGRLHADAKKIKQAQLGLAGFGHAVYLCDQTPAYPNALKGENEPGMLLRGMDFEHTSMQTASDAELEVKQFVEGVAQRAVDLKLLPFIQDRQALFDDLRSASVAMMPSWHEGFGLVAWEAIAAGVPLIVTKKSGVYKFLEHEQAGLYKGFVQAVDIKGTSAEPYFIEQDKTVIAEALIEVAKDASQWRQKSHQLREALLQRYTWAHCAKQFVHAVGWQLDVPAPSGPNITPTQAEDVRLLQSVSNPASKNMGFSPSLLGTWLEIPLPTWQAAQGRSISQLLRAEEAVVPFDPQRQPFLDEQLAWAMSPKHPIAIRLLTGQGGTGKTRLALKFCSQLAAEGWQTGFLRSECDARSMPDLAKKLAAASLGGQATCLVVDYAETRQATLLKLLAELQVVECQASIRILLLARDGGEWWAQLPAQESTCESLLLGEATSGPYVLPPLHDSDESRQMAYQTALNSFARQLSMALPPGLPLLQGEHFGFPLYVQMAALMALHGEKPQSAQGLTRAIVNHESRYWRNATQHLMQDSSGGEAALLMTLATLATGFATVRDVEKIWERSGGIKALLKPLWNALCPLYPGRQGLQGLRPDLLGEALVAQSILGLGGSEILSALLGSGESTTRQSCLTILARLLRQRDDVASAAQAALTHHFSACAQDLFHVCIATPSPLAELAASSFKAAPRVVQHQVAGLIRPMFEHEVLPLTSLAQVVGEALCEKLAPKNGERHLSADKQAAWGNALGNLAIDYSRNGSNELAFKSSEIACCIFEQLAASDKRFEADFATSLNDHAVRLSDHGQDEKALDFTKKGLDIYQRLSLDKSERFESNFAEILNNYAVRLAINDREKEALDFAKKALDILQRLSCNNSQRFESVYANSLNNYANRLAGNGHKPEALIFAKKAVDINQRLAQNKPERFMPAFATSLTNYAVRLSNNGQQDEAFEFSRQALDIDQQLAKNKPERFEPDFALSLGNHANYLSEQGEYREAVILQMHCQSLYERYAQRMPLRYAGNEYDAHLNLAFWCWLATNQAMDEVLAFEVPNLNPRAKREAIFYRSFLQCLQAAATNTSTDAVRICLDDSLSQWYRLDTGQKNDWEPSFLLVASLANHKLGVNAAPPAWSDQLERFKRQRQGRLPQWMRDAASRCGCTLD